MRGHDFDIVSRKFAQIFNERGSTKIWTQGRRSILAACEDPSNISPFRFSGEYYPLPQTGQMWLEMDLLNDPELRHIWCETTSYRDEVTRDERHDIIFPMVEFESLGEFDDLLIDCESMVESLGFASEPVYIDYEAACDELGVQNIEAAEEQELAERYGNIIFLTHFPERTDPFWNMKRSGDLALKVDVLLYGCETFGCAARETDPDVMQDRFFNISNGKYAQTLFAHFGQERVVRELEAFLKLEMLPRYGGGIGVTRLVKAMKKEGIL